MTQLDKLELYALKKKYGPFTSTQDIIVRMEQIEEGDWHRLGSIISRMAFETVHDCIHHPCYPAALERFIELCGVPRPLALAYLRVGLPMRGIILPGYARRRLEVQIEIHRGILRVNGQPVPLPRQEAAQFQILHAFAAER